MNRLADEAMAISVSADDAPEPLRELMCSIVIPCRNEARFIDRCLSSILAGDYPPDRFEVLVVDGMSDDGTRQRVEVFAQQHPQVRLLDNPKRITPAALNVGIRHARGDIIVRMDAHTRYEPAYLSECVAALHQYDADNVGGIWIIEPRDESLFGRAVVRTLSHRFGTGNAHYRFGRNQDVREVDAVPFFCLRRELLTKAGPFNEHLVRGQDMEFNLRLRRLGAKIVLVPTIVSHYYARTDLKSFCLQNWTNGVWAVLPLAYSSVIPVSPRHLAPLAFVLALLSGGAVSLWFRPALWVTGASLALYLALNVGVSVSIARQERNANLAAVLPVTFGLLHFGYGLGSVAGLLKLLTVRQFWRRIFTRLVGAAAKRTANSC